MPLFRVITLATLSLVLLAGPGAVDVSEAAAPSSTRQKADAESQKSKVQSRLSTLQKSLKANEAKSEETAKALKEADQAISRVNRKLRELNAKKEKARTRLKDLEDDRKNVDGRRAQASQHVRTIARAQYLNLKQPAWQRFLEGANPSEVVRERASLRYLAREETRALSLLDNRQKEIDRLTRAAQDEQKNLDRIAREERESRQELVREKSVREKTLKTLQGEIRSQQADINKLRKDEQRLGSLIANLDKKIESERRAAEARQRALQAEKAKKARSGGSKKTALRDDEIITSVLIPEKEFTHLFYRKIGTRRANAISKLSLSAAAVIRDGIIEDFRASSGAAGPKVIRSREAESLLTKRQVSEIPDIADDFIAAWDRAISPHAMPRYRRNTTSRMLLHFLEALQDETRTGIIG